MSTPATVYKALGEVQTGGPASRRSPFSPPTHYYNIVSRIKENSDEFSKWESSESLKKEMATHSSIFAWKIPQTEELGGLHSMGSQRVRHDQSDLAHSDLKAHFTHSSINPVHQSEIFDNYFSNFAF